MTTDRLGKYEIRGVLGKGAMGTVYAAWDPIISRQVAIKTVRLPDAADIDAQEELARFKREAQAAGRLTHPNIVGIFDYGETDEVAYIVMEFVDGRTLKSVLDADERMPIAMVGKIMADLLAGLRYSHDRGVVHRDIKPANVMIVGGDGHGSGQAKIADFGIARIESSNLTQAGTIMGTPAYMSPEQFMGQTVDARTDIYSSGVLLFQLLTGERPFEGSMATIMHKALNTQPPKPSELSVTAPVALDAVVSRAMARRPDDRFPDAGAFAQAITDALEGRAPASGGAGSGLGLGDDFDTESTVVQAAGRPASTRPAETRAPAALPPASKPKPRSKAALLGGVALVVMLAGGGAAAWWFGMFAASEPPNPQLAGRTQAVAPSGDGQTTVVAVAPPSSSTNAAPTPESTPAAQPTSPPVDAQATSTPPAPRADVTQVVPPTTARPDPQPDPAPPASSPPAPTQPAQVVPPSLPSPTAPVATKPPDTTPTPRAGLAGAPPLEPAQVSPPVTVAPPVTVTGPAETRPNATQSTPLEPATVTPPARPERIDPAPAILAPTPTTPVQPLQARPPEPQVARVAPPPPVVAPPEAPNLPQTGTATPPVTVAPTVTAAIVSPEALRRAVAAAVQGTDCAVIRGDLSRSGTLSLQGVIGEGPTTEELLRRLRDAAPTAPLDWTVEEVKGPYCGALNLVRPYTRPFGSVTGGLEVTLRDGRTNLREDDKIDIRAQISSFPAYLQIDYFSSDGSVLHVQTAAQGSPALPARSAQTYVPGAVAPPFGTDLVVAIASSVPLFSKGQVLLDEAQPYLRQLQTALDAATKRRAEIAAGTVVVHTSPKS